MSAYELAQCMPRRSSSTELTWKIAYSRGLIHSRPLSAMFRKYEITSNHRITHFLAQIYIETGVFRTVRESGEGHPNAKLPKAQYYAAFYGRGYMQLTWALNYENYGIYRSLNKHNNNFIDTRITSVSLHIWEDFNPMTQKPIKKQWASRYDPELVSADQFSSADSGGFYWVSKIYRGTSNINRIADLGAILAI